MAISNVPTRPEIHQPILDLLSDGKEHCWSDIVEKLGDHFSLTDKELNERGTEWKEAILSPLQFRDAGFERREFGRVPKT